MKFSCTQENLNHALGIVGRIASRHPQLPILQHVLIQAQAGSIMLASTNLELGVRITIRGKVDEAGSFTVPAQLLANYIGLVTSDRIDCVTNKKTLQITAAHQQTTIHGEEATDFPVIPEIEQHHTCSVARSDFEIALQQTVIAASVDETRPEIAGVYVAITPQHCVLAATDSYRLAEKRLSLRTKGEDEQKVIIPQRSAQEILRITQISKADTITLYVSETQFACQVDDSEVVSRVVEGTFPEYEQIIPQHHTTTMMLDVTTFIKAVKGAALFSKTGINDIELICSPGKQHLTVRAMNAQLGENSTTVSGSGQGEDVSVVFNHRYVLDGLQQIQRQGATQVTMGLSDSLSPGTFRPSTDVNYTYIIMPIKQ